MVVRQVREVAVVALSMADPGLSIIIPCLNEQSSIGDVVNQLQYLRQQGVELIVVDGGSSDNTKSIAEPLVDTLIESKAGRAVQMNAGAEVASGEWLMFLHADTRLPDNTGEILDQLKTTDKGWGFFSINLSGSSWVFRVIEWAITCRSRLTSVATGDQTIFVRREVFDSVGGFADIPLMEDVAFTKIMRRQGHALVIDSPVKTSSRRWEDNGVLSTIVLMWQLRLAYFLGVNPVRLKKFYS